MIFKKLTKKEKEQIREQYKGTWQSVLLLSFEFKVSPNMISYVVNHKGNRDNHLARGKKWREENPDYMTKYNRDYYRKKKQKNEEPRT